MTRFDPTRSQLADQIDRLVTGHSVSRGPFVGPDLDLTSPAHRHLAEDSKGGPAMFPQPVKAAIGHIEHLLFAADDQLRVLAHIIRKPEPAWFGHLTVVRSVVEVMSRIWYLADPDQTAVEVSRRLCNEHLYELNVMDSNLSGPFSAINEDALTDARNWVRSRRVDIGRWAVAHGLKVNGYVGSGRPGPIDLLAQIYGSNIVGIPAFEALGAWHYSELSSAAHGLPKGMSRYLVGLGVSDHPHLVMSIRDLAGSIEPVLTVHDAMSTRLARYFAWPMVAEYLAEKVASRLLLKRAAGHV